MLISYILIIGTVCPYLNYSINPEACRLRIPVLTFLDNPRVSLGEHVKLTQQPHYSYRDLAFNSFYLFINMLTNIMNYLGQSVMT